MRRQLCTAALAMWAAFATAGAGAQQGYTWQTLRDRFMSNNPSLRAAATAVEEARAQQITAYLRPNPTMTAGVDQLQVITGNPYRPLPYALPQLSVNYLHERGGKRELRLESAEKATAIAESQQSDTMRTLLFSLRGSFVQTLQAKAVLQLAQENLAYYDRVLEVGRERFHAGDIAQVDLDRLELEHVQYESDLEGAQVALRTAKIQLLQLLNDHSAIDAFDVEGPFDFADAVPARETCEREAMESRPDLKAAVQAVEKAQSDHRLAMANGSVDPTFGFDIGRNPPISGYVGFNVSIPLRVFDRNQGEKLRTKLEVARNQELKDAAGAQVFSDVDSSYESVNGALTLLRPYRSHYLTQAEHVRDTVTFSYQHGGASLLDFLDAQSSYRNVKLNYINLVGSYLMASAQLNFAVGREVLP